MKFLLNKVLLTIFFLNTVLVKTVNAQSNGSGTGLNPPSTSNGFGYSIKNPLAFDSLQEFILAILNIVIVIATPIVVLFIIFAGFQYVTARGEPAKITQATKALTYAVIGGVLILGAVAIGEIIKDLVSGFSA